MPPRKSLNFHSKQISAPKHKHSINFCDRDVVKIECLKYLKHAVDLPINQESQLPFLLNQFQARDTQASFYKLIGEVGGVASSAFTPMSSQKKRVDESQTGWCDVAVVVVRISCGCLFEHG